MPISSQVVASIQKILYVVDDNNSVIVDAQEILGKYLFPENGTKDTNEKGSFNERSEMDTVMSPTLRPGKKTLLTPIKWANSPMNMNKDKC